MISKKVLCVMLVFGCVFTASAGQQENFDVNLPGSMRQYGVNGQVEDLFGGPMPREWFLKPVSAQMSLHSYVAMMPLTEGSQLKQGQLLLSNEDHEVAGDIVVEVRDSMGEFVKKYMVRIPSGDDRILDLSELAQYEGVRISLFSATPYSAIQMDRDGSFSNDIKVQAPQVEQGSSFETNKAGFCLTLSKTKIKLTNDAGISVAVWAEMSVLKDSSGISKKYLTVYYPFDRVFHYPMHRGWGSHCSNSSTHTTKLFAETEPDHEWVNMEMVIIGLTGQGTVNCVSAKECGSETWTFTLYFD